MPKVWSEEPPSRHQVQKMQKQKTENEEASPREEVDKQDDGPGGTRTHDLRLFHRREGGVIASRPPALLTLAQ